MLEVNVILGRNNLRPEELGEVNSRLGAIIAPRLVLTHSLLDDVVERRRHLSLPK